MRTLCLIFLFLPFLSAAQTYRAIPSTGAMFRLEHYNSSLGADYNINFATHQFVDGDTTFDGRTVIRISYDTSAYCSCWDPFLQGCDNLMNRKFTAAWLWQDTLTGKVYWTRPGDPLHLMIDFSASAGDTVVTELPPTTLHVSSWGASVVPERFAVTAVDTVIFADGIPRRRVFCTSLDYWNMFSVNDEHEWVEGIGDLHKGFLMYPDFYGSDPKSYYWASCYQEFSMDLDTGYTSWCNSGSNCSKLVAFQNAAVNKRPYLAENPSTQLDIRGFRGAATVTVYSSLAQTVAQYSQYISGPVPETSHLPSGIYRVQLEQSGLLPVVLKWVKL